MTEPRRVGEDEPFTPPLTPPFLESPPSGASTRRQVRVGDPASDPNLGELDQAPGRPVAEPCSDQRQNDDAAEGSTLPPDNAKSPQADGDPRELDRPRGDTEQTRSDRRAAETTRRVTRRMMARSRP